MRLLSPSEQSFFLFGPRGLGKNTWLNQYLSEATYQNESTDAQQKAEYSSPEKSKAKIKPRE